MHAHILVQFDILTSIDMDTLFMATGRINEHDPSRQFVRVLDGVATVLVLILIAVIVVVAINLNLFICGVKAVSIPVAHCDP